MTDPLEKGGGHILSTALSLSLVTGIPLRIADEVVRDARAYLVSRAVAGEYLTDQLMLPLALAGGGSFTAMKISRHASTNRDVISLFLPIHFQVDPAEDCLIVCVTRGTIQTTL